MKLIAFLSIVSALKSLNYIGLFAKEAVRIIDNDQEIKNPPKKGGFYMKNAKKGNYPLITPLEMTIF